MPISQKQKQILAFPFTSYDALICDGAVRSGKTVFMTIAFIDDAMRRYNHVRFAICGKTVGSAVQNIIMPYMGLTYAHDKYSLRWKRSDKMLVVSDGKHENVFEVFGGKDEGSFALIQGRTLAGVLFDEVALQPRSFVEQALARCSVDGSKFWFNCNPDSPQHWFYTEWVQQLKKHNALRLHFQLSDNPSLTERIIQRYESMYTGVFYDRYIRGEWVVAQGLVYPMFATDRHIAHKHGAGGEWYVSVDYGTLNPCAMLLWRISDGRAHLEQEYYHSGRDGTLKTDEEYYEALCKLIGDRNVTRIIIDPSAASFRATIQRHGRFVVQNALNDVVNGIRVTAAMLNDGRITIHEDCVNTIREFGLYSWDEKFTDDRVIKENDHAMDAMRYLIYTLRNRYFRYYD
ncbi:MAG: PBSX family phage terminase large subunit [Alistipes sp.]|nr:PBSX family phage terminase large subunit [Alistipes sp.]